MFRFKLFSAIFMLCFVSFSHGAASSDVLTKEQMLQGTTVNLLWVYKDAEEDKEYVLPAIIERNSRTEKKIVQIDTFKQLKAWAEHYNVVLWFDSKMLVSATYDRTTWDEIDLEGKAARLQAIIDKTKSRLSKNISMRDVRDLEIVKANEDVFAQWRDVYYRADFLRVIAAYETVKKSAPGSFFIYADFTIAPLDPEAMMSDETVQRLNTFGIVMAEMRGYSVYENSFQITGNNNKNLLKAIKHIMINKCLKAPSLVGMHYYERDIPQVVYSYYPQMFEVFYALEGKGTLTNRDGVVFKPEDIKKVLDWVGQRTLTSYWGTRFQMTDPSLIAPADMGGVEKLHQGYTSGIFIPRKDVKAPYSNHGF